MARAQLIGLAIGLVASAAAAQVQDRAQNRTVLGANEFLAAGAEQIRVGEYDEGIRLTNLGLREVASVGERSAALSNLCAAYAAKGNPDRAIDYCTQSIVLKESNWRAYSNRSYAFYLKGLYKKAHDDLEIAASINPEARQIAKIRGMINERSLQPSVIMEDHR
jgi:tetratricopeptide (TPR) repeat protein